MMILKKNSLCRASPASCNHLKPKAWLANDNEQTCPAPRASKAKQGRRSARNRTAQVRGSLSLVNAGGTRHGVARALTAVAAASPTQAQRSRAEPNQTPPHHYPRTRSFRQLTSSALPPLPRLLRSRLAARSDRARRLSPR
jgi:hypothetical protein